MNSSIPILLPPMRPLQLLHHAQLPFPATAPLASSTPRITTPSPPPKDFESEGKRAAEELHRNKRERESHSGTEHVSKKRKRNHKAVEKYIKAKELMLKRRQRRFKVVKKPKVIDVDKYKPSQTKKAKTRNSGSGNLVRLKETEIFCWVPQDYSMTVSLMQLRSFSSGPSQHSLTCRVCVVA